MKERDAAKELGFEEQTWRLAGVGWNVQARASALSQQRRMAHSYGHRRWSASRAGPRWAALVRLERLRPQADFRSADGGRVHCGHCVGGTATSTTILRPL